MSRRSKNGQNDSGADAVELDEAAAPDDPVDLFRTWYRQALSDPAPDGLDPTAMTLATAGPDGVPDARIVLLKAFDERGFVFYTNYLSNKARQLEANPHAALVVYWPLRRRQVRVTGAVGRVSRAESRAYFASRPRGSQLGAAASPQSRVIESRCVLEREHRRLSAEFADEPIPCPDHWGGFRVEPTQIEFWLSRDDRLHDRLRYTRQGAGTTWRIQRLAP